MKINKFVNRNGFDLGVTLTEDDAKLLNEYLDNLAHSEDSDPKESEFISILAKKIARKLNNK